MIKADELKNSVEDHLQGTDMFVVDIKVKTGNNITILLDRDSGIRIDDCIKLTRFIESQYDREVEDYSLVVSSAGIGQPLKLLRQYLKIIGKEIDVELNDKTVLKAILLAADDEKIVVKTTTKIKKEIIEKESEIPFNTIKSVKEVISFK